MDIRAKGFQPSSLAENNNDLTLKDYKELFTNMIVLQV